MKEVKKLMRILAVSGVMTLAAASMAFAQSPGGADAGLSPEAGTPAISREESVPHAYPGKQAGVAGRSDSEIKSDVEKAVKRHKDLSVSVKDRVVTLSGKVADESERRDAVTVTRDVAGVRVVQDQIQIVGGDSHSIGEYVDDTAITTAVKGKILMEKNLSTLDIGVDTVNGVVTLTGSAESPELVKKAGAVAREVKGVKRIDNKLLVKP